MGLSNFPSPAEGVLPVLVMNTVMSVAILKNLLRSFLQLVGAVNWVTSNFETNPTTSTVTASTATITTTSSISETRRLRGISITQFKYLCATNNNSYRGKNKNIQDEDMKNGIEGECCVCLCKFEDEEEVSELSCKHFFHRNCLEKWFDNHHTTCPLCRSIH
ncbi:probable E3 ubiquitin-protein ligase XERICO [Chenopodium quinoa]|uniref:probable E3 ubiquitin-protein ligase XERICO n=1 Tax=Chenopodium quinoa TaxID=63459 RepID=UPI000B77D118|nr:probable E3 ubiquitin-protein ligase XERICO [Chenopodium quinoa]